MALTEKTYIDKIEVTAASDTISLREVTVILRDDVEISRSYHRYSVNKDTDTASFSAEVLKMCETIWDAGLDLALNTALANTTAV